MFELNQTLRISVTNRLAWIYVAIGLLLVVSWSGLLDPIALTEIDESLLNAGIMYGTGRAINAMISVLQSSSVSAVFFSINIGELADPINDLIERFSEVMTYALASLALQKVLLVASTHNIFNILLTLAALGVLGSNTLGHSQLFTTSVKSFAILAFVRIVFAIVILFNAAVDALFLEKQTTEKYQAMTLYEEEITSISNELSGVNPAISDAIKQLQIDITSSTQEYKALQNLLIDKQQQLEGQEKAIEQRVEEVGRLKSIYSDDEELSTMKKQLEQLEAEHTILESKVENAQKDLDEKNEALDCANKNLKGESCGVLDWIQNKSNNLDIKAKIEDWEC